MNYPSIARNSSRLRLVLGLCLLLGLCMAMGGLAAPRAHAQTTLTVSTCDESHLDAAVAQANSDNANDTITFSCSGVIPLSSTLSITGSMTLDGSGQNVTLDGQRRVQVLSVNSGVSFTLNALTIAHGSSNGGGGLNNYFNSTVSITNSTFYNNTAAEGGGLYNYFGTVSITNSTFAYNVSYADGGGLFTTGTVSITNSTFADNGADTSGNDLALQSSGKVSIGGSIVGDSSSSTNLNCIGVGILRLNITDNGYNLASDSSCGFTGTGSLQNTDPQLDPNGLQDNGGPTQTLALLYGSPAIDRIPAASCPGTDQRGMSRPDQGESTCDMGAYESNFDDDLSLTNLPANITTNATSPQGAVVTYTLPTVVDEETPLPAVTCSPASGSTFPISTTTVTCSVSDSDDLNSPVTQSFTVTVNPVLVASRTSVSAMEGKSFSGVVVASGTDIGAGTLSASIDWGDGQVSSGTVSLASDGSYSVKGSHAYDEEGSFPITVTVSASGGMSATATDSASVADAALTANTPTVVIQKLAVTASTVFFDADPNGTASDYSATLAWGDGSTTSGTISMNSTNFTATGSHSYAKHKTYTVTITITDAGGSSVTKTLTIKV